MGWWIKDGNGGHINVRRYDTTLMMNPQDIFPDNQKEALKYIKKKKGVEGKVCRLYRTANNSTLVRKVFRVAMQIIIDEVIAGQCKFTFPYSNNYEIYMGKADTKGVIAKSKNGTNPFDLFVTNRTIPRLKFSKGKSLRKKDLIIYVSKDRYQKIIDRANSGKKFSNRPRDLYYFLPKIYEEFSYLEEDGIRRLLMFCFRKMGYYLKRGEEFRFIDKTGEIRFYRPLGEYHDLIMRSVVERRKKREALENAKTIS